MRITGRLRAFGIGGAARCRDLDDRCGRMLGDDLAVTARSLVAALAVLAIASVLMLYRLGEAEVCGFNEAVEALVMQDMLERGNLLFPRASGDEPSYKPPMVHWVATVLARVLGASEVSELSVRLPSVFFALAGIGVTMVFVHRHMGAHTGVLAGLILAAAMQYVRQGRYGRVDMALTFFETATLLVFLTWAIRTTRRPTDTRTDPWLWLLALTAGAGVLTKGPVGAVLPLAAIMITLAMDRRWDLARKMFRWGPTIAFLTLSISWYALCALAAKGDFLSLHLGTENLGRFTGSLGRMPTLYYLNPLLMNSPPLTFLAPLAVVAALRPGAGARDELREPRETSTRLFAIFWLVTVVFFSLAAYKRRAYLLPIWPAAAILIAEWLRARAQTANGKALRGAVTAACGILVLVNFVVAPLIEIRQCPAGNFKHAASAIRAHLPPSANLVSVGGTGGGDLAALRFYLQHPLPARSAMPAGSSSHVLLVEQREDGDRYAAGLPGYVPLGTFRPGRGTITLYQRSRDGHSSTQHPRYDRKPAGEIYPPSAASLNL